MKKLLGLLLIIVLVGSTGCARWKQKNKRNLFDNKAHDIKVTLYSGGQAVRVWDLKDAIISNSDGSDGYYFYEGGKLIEISGDIVIEYQD